MKQIFSIIVLLFLTAAFVNAQSVSNIRFEQSDKQVVIHYDLSGESGSKWNIDIFCSQDGGKTWGSPLRKITGELGYPIEPGTNKKVIWDVLAEREKLEGVISFKVKATEKNGLVTYPPINKPNFSDDYYKYRRSKNFWFVSAFVTGGIGTFTYLQSGKYYTQYQSATTDADDLHAKADLYNKIAPIALGIAGICTIEFILKAGKQSKAKKEKLSFYPRPLFRGGGFGLAYTF